MRTVHYFAPTFRVLLAQAMLARYGPDAWRHLIRLIALHEAFDCAFVRGMDWKEPKPYEMDSAFWHAVCGRNVDRAGHAELHG